MLFTHIDIIDESFEYQKDLFVGVEGAHIEYVGASEPEKDYGERYDGRRKLLMPGLYNAHAHAPMTLLRGYAENLPLQRWLNEMVFPFEAFIDEASAYPATLLAAAEMLRFGVVSFTDMYYHEDARARAVAESGIKCNMSHGIISFDDVPYDKLPAFEVNERILKEYHGAFDGRMKVDLCIHAEYTTTPALVEAVGQSAVDHDVRTHIHLSETKLEHEECKERHGGLTPAAYFESLGFFRQPCTAAHCVYTEPGDWEIFRRHGVTVASCPASNMKLASGFAPAAAMLDAGIALALGTDGPASNNNHDMLQDLHLFALAGKGSTGDPTVITPQQALAVATYNGALSQGRDDCGLIREGHRADLCVLDTDVPWMWPVHDMPTNVVYAAHGSDVCLTMVDGKVLYREGEWPTIDIEKAQSETQRWADAIKARVAAS